MASKNRTILICYEDQQFRWYLTNDTQSPFYEHSLNVPNEESLDELRVKLSDHNALSLPVVFGLGHQETLSASFPIGSKRQARSPQALAYQLEEQLPIAAEEFVADFSLQRSRAFGVAVKVSLIDQVLFYIKELQLDLRAITPLILLAKEGLCEEQEAIDNGLLLWIEGATANLVEVTEGETTQWRYLPAGVDEFEQTRQLRMLQNEQEPNLFLVGPEKVATSDYVLSIEQTHLSITGSILSYAAQQAQRIANGQCEQEINLLSSLSSSQLELRNPLESSWWFLRVAALLLCLSVAVWQSLSLSEHNTLIMKEEQAQRDIYQELYPDKRVPQGIMRRLESEQRRLRGTKGDEKENPLHADALRPLYQCLASLPEELRFRLLDLRIERETIQLQGEARSHGDADRIAASLRQSGLLVSPPSTTQLAEKGVSFQIKAEQQPLPPNNKSGAKP